MILKGKKVLVTGADGFIGSHLTEALVQAGCKVRAFSYYNSFNSLGWLDTIDKSTKNKIEVISGDVRDQGIVDLSVSGQDIVFHLAALIGIPYSYNAPGSYVDTNVKGTLHVLESARKTKVKKVLITSTSEVYGTAQYVPMDENHPLQGQSPYSASKIGADKIAESFFRSFGIPVVIVRPFNTYGPRQSARAIIPTIISQLLNGQKELKIGSSSPKRDFNYVSDTCSGFLAIASSDKTIGQEINICSGQDISIGELAGRLVKMINPKASIVTDKKRIRPELSEVMHLLGANDKIKKLTGWQPAHTLESGLVKTIEWFRKGKQAYLYKPDQYNV